MCYVTFLFLTIDMATDFAESGRLLGSINAFKQHAEIRWPSFLFVCLGLHGDEIVSIARDRSFPFFKLYTFLDKIVLDRGGAQKYC